MLTVNVALTSDAETEGGRLLGLYEGAVLPQLGLALTLTLTLTLALILTIDLTLDPALPQPLPHSPRATPAQVHEIPRAEGDATAL